MRKIGALLITVILMGGLIHDAVARGNGRQPCDRGAGGISHCSGDKFICNDGRVSGSKKICNPKIYGTAPQPGKKK